MEPKQIFCLPLTWAANLSHGANPESETLKMNFHRKRAAGLNSLRKKIMEEEKPALRKSRAIHCLRCNGHMTFEKYYGPSNCFFGMRCLLCGDILDPIILLHRLSRDARIPIPEGKDEFLFLIRKYLGAEPEPFYPEIK